MLPITLTIAAVAVLLNIWLSARCIQVRYRAKIMTGDGDHPLMLCRMRAQANYVENAPFVLILLGLIEYTKGPVSWLWGAGLLFVVARVFHAIGMDQSARPDAKPGGLRGIGAMLTWGVQLGLAGTALWIVYTGHH